MRKIYKVSSHPRCFALILVKKLQRQRIKNIYYGLYDYIQINFCYSSNRLASNRLMLTQVEEIYKKGKVSTGFEPIKVDDLIEAYNHIVQFGENYYQTTIKEEIQNKAKQRIGATGGKKVKALKYIQEFFYSLEYGDVQAKLFTPQWTILEDHAKDKLLEANENLPALTDAELRDAISEIRPKSDWERFFSHKVSMDDPAASIKRLSTFRNSVAHAKFFNRDDYEKCRQLIKSLNLAILEAIRITEEQDFAEKNMEALRTSVAGVLEKMQTFTEWVGKKAIQTAQALIPTFEKLGRIVMEIERDDRIKNMLQADREDTNSSHDMEMDNFPCDNDDLTETE